MKGEAQPLIQFFDGWKTHLIIPVYQRNYDWSEENCKQLFNDLIALHRSGRPNHFFGSIVSQVDPGSRALLIIDGQQRLTTVSLLLLAMASAQKEGRLDYEETTGEDIVDSFIINVKERQGRNIKLQPIQRDMQAYDALIGKPADEHIETSNVTRNYNYLRRRVTDCGLTLDQLLDVIQRLEVISISLERDDDPQLIFESLNSTGLGLSESDKVRNYLLMSQAPADQERLYTQYWNRIEEYTEYDPSPLLRDYLTMQRGRICNSERIYTEFKAYSVDSNSTREQLLEDLLHHARLYHQIATGSFRDTVIDAKLKQMAPLGLNVAFPFLMAFFDYARENQLSTDERYGVLHLVENYWVRRLICRCPSNALNKVFMTLHRDVVKHLKAASPNARPTYTDVATYVLLQKEGSALFPRDSEVCNDFLTRDVYRMPANTREFILERMENQDSKEVPHDIVNGLRDGTISIEHIMPQTLSQKWKEELGPGWEDIHSKYLHTLANLTVTAYNVKYSNATFLSKRDMQDGFASTAYRLNSYLKTCNQWTETELRERGQLLLNVFMRLWPEPETTFAPAIPQTDTATLDDEDFEGTNRTVRAYIYRDERHPVSKWLTMLVEVSALIYSEKPATVAQFCANGKWRYYTHPAHGCSEFAQGLYVHTSSSTADKLRILRHLFAECGIPGEELVFELRPSQETSEDADEE